MLAHILAIAVGLGSFAVYMAAFFFPEVHRKNDFFWSGVGFFYALILWLCAGRITGAVLLGQVASVALLSWFGWQTLYLRRAVTPASQQTPVPPQLHKQLNGLLAIKAEDKPAMPTVYPSSVAVQTPPEPVETEPKTAPLSSETPEVLEDVPPSVEPEKVEEVETQPISQPEIAAETPPLEPPEPAPISETEIEFEDEILEEKTETTSQPSISTQTPPQPQRSSRLLQTITGFLNRGKKQPPSAVSPTEKLTETQAEEPKVEPEHQETPTPETVVEPEEITSQAEPSDPLEPDTVIETPSPVEVQEITITVEPETPPTTPDEEVKSTSEEPETVDSEHSSEEILELTSVVDENPVLKRPNPPNSDEKTADQKPEDKTDSDS